MTPRTKIVIVCTILVFAFYGVAIWMGVTSYRGIFAIPAAILLIILMVFSDFIDFGFIEKIVTKIKNKKAPK